MNPTNQKILNFIKRNKDELSSTTSIDEFADLLYECFAQLKTELSQKEKVSQLFKDLTNENSDEAEALVEGDLKNYITRLVKFVESDDPLEKNNLKQRSSSGSSDESDNKKTYQRKRDRSRDREKNKKSKQKNSSSSQNTLIHELQKALGKDMNIKKLLTNLTNNNNNRKPQQQNKNIVFLQNLPREMRSYSEIETLLSGKGDIAKIQLIGRVPSVQFKNQIDAQNIINKFIVHKGIKIEFTAGINKIDDKKSNILIQEIEDKKTTQNQTVSQQQQQQQQQQPSQTNVVTQKQEIEEENTEVKKQKEESEMNSQLESLKNSAKTMIVDKLRLALLLGRRKEYYSQQVNAEIEELKKMLAQKKEEIAKITSLDQIKNEIQWLNQNYDYTLEVSDIPEQLFKDKLVMKALTEELQKYGKVETLAIKIKERVAHVKFVSFDIAEKAYTQNQTNFKIEFINKAINKIVIAQN